MSQRLTRMAVDGEPEQECKRLAPCQETLGLERVFSGSLHWATAGAEVSLLLGVHKKGGREGHREGNL
jgi:hypothetical protein